MPNRTQMLRISCVKPRVRGLIYGGAGRPAWRFGHRQTFFQNVLPGFLGFGHRRLIQRICSPWFSVYLIDIGHRRQFALICSPCFPVKKENKSAQMSSCAQCRTSHGEQFKQNQRLCPKSPEYSKKQGEQICEMPLLCPNPGIRGEAEFQQSGIPEPAQQSGIPEACPAKRHHRSPSCTS